MANGRGMGVSCTMHGTRYSSEFLCYNFVKDFVSGLGTLKPKLFLKT